VAPAPTGNQRLAGLMSEAGFGSRKAFARAIRTASAEAGRPAGCDHTSVSRWLRGVTPRADTAAWITAVLSRALGRAVTLADAGLGSAVAVPPDLGLGYSGHDDAWLAALSLLWAADIADAGVVVASVPSATAWRAVPLDWLVAGPQSRRSPGTAGAVGMADVARVRAATGMFAELDNSFGGGHARRVLVHYLQDEVQDLLRGRFTDSVGDALYSTAAQAMLLVAWMSYDSGLHGLAQRYFIQAIGLAEAGRNRILGASILDAMSHQATFLGRFTDAATLASAARTGTRGLAPATLTAHFHAMEARALARAGDRRGCHLALAETVRIFERRDIGSDPDWFRYFDEAELAAELAHCFRDLGEYSAAASQLSSSRVSSCGPRSDFFVTMVRAEAVLGLGDADRACAIALGALTLGEHVQSARCISYLNRFTETLAPYESAAAVREFRQQAARSPRWQASQRAGSRT
jgi:hypothetical protein